MTINQTSPSHLTTVTSRLHKYCCVIFLIMVGFAVSQATFTHESDPVFLSYVMCTGNESSLLSCSHPGIGYDYYHQYYYYLHHYYQHWLYYNDAWVICTSCKSLSYYTCTPRCQLQQHFILVLLCSQGIRIEMLELENITHG